MVTKITERKPKQKDNCQSYFSGKNCSTSTATILLMELSLYCLRYYYLKSWCFLSTPLFEWAAISISCSRKTWRIPKKHITNIKVEAYRKKRIWIFYFKHFYFIYYGAICFFIVLFSYSIKSFEVNDMRNRQIFQVTNMLHSFVSL